MADLDTSGVVILPHALRCLSGYLAGALQDHRVHALLSKLILKLINKVAWRKL
jgi:hypothetical protein